MYNLSRNNQFDSSKARRELGYTTRSYRETIHDETAWLKRTGKIANPGFAASVKTAGQDASCVGTLIGLPACTVVGRIAMLFA